MGATSSPNHLEGVDRKIGNDEKVHSVMPTPPRYAGLWPRFLALMADLALFCAIFFPTTRIIKGVWMMSPEDHRWASGLFITDPLCIVFLLVMCVYFIVAEGTVGATAGKWLVGIRVVQENGRSAGLRRSLIRNFLRFVDGLPALNILGVILILRSPECARFGDRVAGTRVVHTR